MPVSGLNHVNIVTPDLDGAVAFYRDVLGLQEVPAPAMPPGVVVRWMGDVAGRPIVHLVAYDPDRHGASPPAGATGALDHVAFDCADFAGMRARCETQGAPFRIGQVREEFSQLFVTDPHGVLVELNFRS